MLETMKEGFRLLMWFGEIGFVRGNTLIVLFGFFG